ncbi:BTAD domain-containing putative transcriptional regulator [Mycobacterium sp.]|uniref:BTAD domain-containing putative transcriptional regulator n=1 Tax=Mycobacterium sp. TaxID=1785 RepID=UPI002C6A1F6C|nr:BTAD domain-containing putative transcriptional regulator [Mycobacterium sp.]HTQ17102.1 BTAD domain-containing putative transcriptional regulator [Mycobacterium sp.]
MNQTAAAVAETRLGFNVLGALQMTVGGKPVTLGTPKQKAILASLIINRNHPVASDRLISDAWEDRPPDKPDGSLHTYIAELRKLLKEAGLDDKTVLARKPPGYQLALAEDQCDIGRFQAKSAAGVRALNEGRFQQGRLFLVAALSEWKGAVLADLRDLQFAQVFGTALGRDYLTTLEKWAEAEIACGRASVVLSRLEELVTEHQYEEPLWAQLITALYVTERQTDALAACRRLRKILRDDQGADPIPRIQQLEERILRQEPLDAQEAAKLSALQTLTVITQSSGGSAWPVTAYLRDARTGQSHALSSGLTNIGRLDDNDIMLADVEISRRHAAIVDTRASYLIVDLRSRNGVQVDGERIKTSALLADGSAIRIGGYEFVFDIRADGPSQ